MIRDLTEIAVEMTRQEKTSEIAEKAELNAEERILDILLPAPRVRGRIFMTLIPEVLLKLRLCRLRMVT